MTARFGEGDWFALPVKGGGWALGVIARRRPRSSALLGYFFGPRRPEPPKLADAAGLTKDDAIFTRIFGYLGLKDGRWIVLGKTEGWDRDEWPMPVFIRQPHGSGRPFHIYYDSDDPAKEIRAQRILPGESIEGPMDGSSGDVAVSIHVGNLLDGAGLWPDLVAYPPPREVPKGLVSHLAGAGPDEDQACLSIQAGLYLKEVFETRADEGAEGSGDDWAALVRVLVAERMPELADTIDLDPDAQELFIYSDDAKSLKRLQSALASLGDHLADTTQLFARANLE